MPKVSVIIPCYNVQKYIRQCIDSLLAQTLSDFEIICVDDGSTDETVDILKEYVKTDSRIKLLEQKNQYAGVARNNGLAVAEGEYVIFLDSDDFFAETMLETACSTADENSADVVVFGFRRFDEKKQEFFPKEELPRKDLLPDEAVFSAVDISDNIFKFISPAPWTKLFRRSFVQATGLQFQPLPNSNDFFFILSALSLAERISTVQEALAFYRVNMPSSTQGKKHKNPLCFLTAINALHGHLQSRGLYDVFEKSFQAIALSSSLYNLRSASTDAARFSVIEALGSDENIISSLLGHEEDFYVDKTTAGYASTIRNAVSQYNIMKNVKQKADTKNVVPYRGKEDIKVSVVIPVYNTGDYLHATVASICGQTLSDIEIICINDGSTDNSLDILKEWAKKDPRISVWTHENAGLSCTRNSGIELAQGKYIYFMDSDDILEEKALETLFVKANEQNLDVIYFDADVFYDNPELEEAAPKFNYKRSRSYSEVYRGQDLFAELYDNKEYLTPACFQMLKKEYIDKNNFCFHPGIIHEDNAFTFATILNAERASHISEMFFHRRIRENSIMTTAVSFKNAYGYFISYQDMMQAYSEVKDKLADYNESAIMARIGLNLYNAQNSFANMPKEELGRELGLGQDMRCFERLVVRPGNAYRQVAEFKEKEAKYKKDKKSLTAKNKKVTADYEKLKKNHNKLKKKQKKLEKTNEKIRSTRLRRFILCCWENGYGYTLKRYSKGFYKKLFGKKN